MMELVKLGDTATFINGYAFKPSEWSHKGKEIIRIQNLTKNSGEANRYNGELPPRYLVKTGDLLISWSATLGVYEWKGEDAWLNQHIFKVQFDKRAIDKRYFKYLIQSKLHELEKLVHGATMKHITKGKFDNISVYLPTLSLQRQIADTLDKADALRQKDQQLLQKYDELAQSIFYEMFGDVSKVVGAENVLRIIGGAAFKSIDFIDDGVPLIRIGTINKGFFDDQQLVFLPSKFFYSHKRYLVYPGDLLMTLTGTVGKDDYGNVFILDNEFDKYFLNQRVAKIEYDPQLLTSEYLRFFFRQKTVKEQLTGISRGVRQANISNQDIYDLQIPIPPIEEQKRFTRSLHMILQMRNDLKRSQSELLFQTLLSQSFKA